MPVVGVMVEAGLGLGLLLLLLGDLLLLVHGAARIVAVVVGRRPPEAI